ncbi:MAG: glycerate kinase [Planctomycetaceae bacterium]
MTRSLRAAAAHLTDAAIAAVRPETLLPRRLAWQRGELLLDGRPFTVPVRPTGRIAVIGGGKAAAGMAAALDAILHDGDVTGLVSVPEGCGRPVARIEIPETRPPAANLPTAAVVAVTHEMRRLLATLGSEDLAVVIVTGGGSALLEEPAPGVDLADLIAVTRFLSAAGADIRELNVVRQAVSLVKAGGLARACTAGRLVAVVLSDVIGDPLDLIASGPCMPAGSAPDAALAILRRHAALDAAPRVTRHLEEAAVTTTPQPATGGEWTTPAGCRVSHVLVGSNATAVDAASRAAHQLGYDVTIRHAGTATETAEAVGRRLATEAAGLVTAARHDGRARAVIEGGEAVVTLPRDHGTGGRNQQTVLAAVEAWQPTAGAWPAELLIASVGTDGEDGPTAAAGGLVDRAVAEQLTASGIDLARAIDRCDAYPALAAAGGLIVTGPTGTNVADVRIILARP